MTGEKKLTWFQLMWKNGYVQLFPVAVLVFIVGIVIWDTAYFVSAPFTDLEFNGAWCPLVIGALMIFLLAYKGFYQFWRDYSSGKSR
jgi:K+ transporter